jgi:hypothetical protein
MERTLLILMCVALAACAQEISPVDESLTEASLQSLEQYQKGSSYALNCGVAGFEPNNYAWDFGDGTKRTTEYPGVAHTYRESGTYFVTCEATDDTIRVLSNMTLTVTVDEIFEDGIEIQEPTDILSDFEKLTDMDDIALQVSDIPDGLPDIDWDDDLGGNELDFGADDFTLSPGSDAGTGTGSIANHSTTTSNTTTNTTTDTTANITTSPTHGLNDLDFEVPTIPDITDTANTTVNTTNITIKTKKMNTTRTTYLPPVNTSINATDVVNNTDDEEIDGFIDDPVDPLPQIIHGEEDDEEKNDNDLEEKELVDMENDKKYKIPAFIDSLLG